ncbi:MAG TPA: MFS transporter [Dehalococcoidia bacterium]|nr:MFS transporter [Dehalococcoidia bacterium]
MISKSDTTQFGSTKAWIFVGILAGGHTLYHWVVQGFIVVLPEVQHHFFLNSIGVGLILTVREVSTGLVSLPGGILSDALKQHWTAFLTLCIGGFGAGVVLLGVSPAFPLLLIGIAIIAATHSFWHLSAASTLSRSFPNDRGTVLSFHGIGGSIGDAGGPFVTGLLLYLLGWQKILSFYGVIAIGFAFVFLFSVSKVWQLRESKKDQMNYTHHIGTVYRALKQPVIWGISIVKGLRGMSLVALLTILPLYFYDELSMGPSARGLHIGLLIVIGIITKPLAGYLSDRFGRKQVLIPGLIWSSLIALSLVIFSQGIFLAISIVLLGVFLYPDQPIITAATLDIAGENISSSILGVTATIGLAMSAMSPIIAGVIYQNFGFDMVMVYLGILFAIAAAITFTLPLNVNVTDG